MKLPEPAEQVFRKVLEEAIQVAVDANMCDHFIGMQIASLALSMVETAYIFDASDQRTGIIIDPENDKHKLVEAYRNS